MATLKIISDPIGSQYVQTLDSDDPDDLNDFDIRIVSDENVNLAESDVTVSSGSSLVSFEGENSVYHAVIRPPETAGTVTVSIAENAVPQDNPAVSQDIRVSTSFPDADAEVPTQLFTISDDDVRKIAVSPTRMYISHSIQFGTFGVKSFLHDGTEQTSEDITISRNLPTGGSDFINGDILISDRRYTLDGTEIADLPLTNPVHTRIGFLDIQTTTHPFRRLPYGTTDASDRVDLNTLDFPNLHLATGAHQDDLLYLLQTGSADGYFAVAEITADDMIAAIGYLNIANTGGTFHERLKDLAVYRDTLYTLQDNGTTGAVYTLDIRKYRPLNKNTKNTIYPVFANEGDTIDLTQFCPDAHTITFGLGFDKPDYLSINADNELEITSNAVTETTPVLVRCTGINYIDSVDFSFYLIIVSAENPVVRDVDELTMRTDSSYDLFGIVSNANSITFRTGQTQPTGSSIANGVFTIGTVGGTAYFTATNANGNTHFQMDIDVLQAADRANFSDDFDVRIEIGGVEIHPDDVLVYPSVSVSLDAIQLNAYRANEVSLTLKSDSTNDFYYNDGIADNFWTENSLNPAGFREPIKIFVDSVVGNDTHTHLLFSGTILDNVADINETRVRLTCIDLSLELRNTPVEAFGRLQKWDALRQQSDEVSFEGVYVPEGSLLPIQLYSGEAWHDRTQLTIRDLALPSEGVALANTAYLTTATLQTSGGFLDDIPVLKFLTQHRAEDVKFLLAQLGLNQDIYNVETDLLNTTLDTPYILNRGSVPFSVENTRITRLPVGWVHDSTNDRLLSLLSNPEAHIADLLVQYDLESDSYRTLHTFDKGLSTHRIARRTATDYYILSAKAIPQDRSASEVPRHSDGTGYAYDAIAEGSEIKIYRYNASTDTLTEHVASDNARPPQLGIHYHVGFENEIYIDEFEGIVPSNRDTFKWVSDNLYYRYATPSEFGVARVDTAGTTSEMIDQTTLNYNNHLNFAFDVTSGGDVYFVYATGDADESSLVIKRRTSGGTESTRLTDTQDVDALTVLDEQGGVYLGCFEALFYDDNLYMLCPIGRVDYDEDDDETTRSRTKASGMALYRCNVTDSSPTLTVIETWDFATRGGCNLVLHDSAVHFMEHSPALTHYKPINPDLENYWTDADETETMGYNQLADPLGVLKKINSDDTVESLGNLYFEERAYNVAMTRPLSVDGDLHVTMGYGDPEAVLRYNALASKNDNFSHLVVTDKLHYVVPTFDPTGNRYELFADLAKKTNATFSFENGLVSIKDRSPIIAETDGATGTGTGDLDFDGENKALPTSGYVKIDDEIIGYTGVSSGALTGVSRGELGTTATDHADGTKMVFLDDILEAERLTGDFTIASDTTRVYNIIESDDDATRVRDPDSIAMYGNLRYPLSLGLTHHENAWRTAVFDNYLENLKDLQPVVSLRVKPSFWLRLGSVIGFKYEGLVYSLQIISLVYEKGFTQIRGRTVG